MNRDGLDGLRRLAAVMLLAIGVSEQRVERGVAARRDLHGRLRNARRLQDIGGVGLAEQDMPMEQSPARRRRADISVRRSIVWRKQRATAFTRRQHGLTH